jgi:hypothetical protein
MRNERQKTSYCHLVIENTKGYPYTGEIIWDDGREAIVAIYEPCSSGVEADHFLLLEAKLKSTAAWYSDEEELKTAWHQISDCKCERYEMTCPAGGMPPYQGPRFTAEEFDSIPYLNVYDDYDLELLKAEPAASYYIDSVYTNFLENPEWVELFVNALRRAGNREAHALRANNKQMSQASLAPFREHRSFQGKECGPFCLHT